MYIKYWFDKGLFGFFFCWWGICILFYFILTNCLTEIILKQSLIASFSHSRYYIPSVLLFCFIIPTIVPNLCWDESLWNAYFLAGILRYCCGLNATWLVNSAAHMWGNRPYDKRINPAENIGVSIGSMGEGFHNYHHTFPQDYKTSELGWRINFTTMFIDFFAMLGQVYDRKTIDPEVIMKRKQRTGDMAS